VVEAISIAAHLARMVVEASKEMEEEGAIMATIVEEGVMLLLEAEVAARQCEILTSTRHTLLESNKHRHRASITDDSFGFIEKHPQQTPRSTGGQSHSTTNHPSTCTLPSAMLNSSFSIPYFITKAMSKVIVL
jgi:hypothetical protein